MFDPFDEDASPTDTTLQGAWKDERGNEFDPMENYSTPQPEREPFDPFAGYQEGRAETMRLKRMEELKKNPGSWRTGPAFTVPQRAAKLAHWKYMNNKGR